MRRAILPALVCLPACLGDGARLVGAGWYFGECGGRCNADLTIAGEDLRLIFTSNSDETTDLINRGTMDRAAVVELGRLAGSLTDAALLEVYGQPDAADGGGSYLELVVDGVLTRTDWEHDRPPPELADAEALLLDDLIDALTDCVATSRVRLVACSPAR